MSRLQFAGITKSFGSVPALQETNLTIAAGEFLTLLGPSGSGKTTLLNIAAGYLASSTGRVMLDDRDITALPPRRRNMGMVFQSYALFPHMNVFENIAYGLKVRSLPREKIRTRVAAILAAMHLEGFADRPVRHLSGGQQQRVALARAIVFDPDILLMDEPLGALDRQLRKQVQLEIRRLHLATPRTTIYVTHDQEEALVMSDRIAIMRAGRIVQIGTGRDLYETPADAFVARFLGESNLLQGRVSALDATRAALAIPGLDTPVIGRAAPGLVPGGIAYALIRPERVRPDPTGIAVRLAERIYLGEMQSIRCMLPGGQDLWCRRVAGQDAMADAATIAWDADAVSILPETQTPKETPEC